MPHDNDSLTQTLSALKTAADDSHSAGLQALVDTVEGLREGIHIDQYVGSASDDAAVIGIQINQTIHQTGTSDEMARRLADLLAELGPLLEPRDRITVHPAPDPPPSLPEALAAIVAVVRGTRGAVVLTPEQAREAAVYRPADLTALRASRIAEWSQPRYRLDSRFVELTLLVDQGEESASGRWAPKQERYTDLRGLLASVPDPAVVLLGPPGSGKSTLLRRLELDTAIDALRAGAGSPSPKTAGGGDWVVGADAPITFFVQLNQYKPARPGAPLPAPGDWLTQRWSERFPALPQLDTLLGEGRVVLLLDALNEMPAADVAAFREQVGLWKAWLGRLIAEQPGNRAVLSCRTLDYSAPLSTPALRVPQVQIEPLANAQVERFLELYTPSHAQRLWAALAGTAQIEALRSPYFLALLAEQVEATGEMPGDRAALFTGFVRQALRREVERDNPLFNPDTLLDGRDVRRLAQWRWWNAYELPGRGVLIPKLAGLAYRMQVARADGGASQVRVGYDEALGLVDHARDEDIVKAGVALAVLEEDPAADEVLYRHQLVQEYFAARVMAEQPDPEKVRAVWRAEEIAPSVRELIETLAAGETLPALPQTGWEETVLLAAPMVGELGAFVREIMEANLVLAGRIANLPEMRERLPEGLVEELRWALVGRSRDPAADLRVRIAAGLEVGDLGDPRFERQEGPEGAYLLPPLVEIPGGAYPIGEDESIERMTTGASGTETAHVPRHEVEIAGFQVAQFLVTNAEWRCFMEAEGYEDERWWDTEDARAWRRGELANEGAKHNSRIWRKGFQENSDLFDQMVEEGRFPSKATEELWREWMLLDDAVFEAALDVRFQVKRATEPAFWHDERYNAASQPVVGICWYEARAYCNWMSAQTGLAFRLPTEVEWEAAARGVTGRLYAYGDTFDRAKGNTIETHVRRPAPVGVFVEGDTPKGMSDMAGNVQQWTSSAWGGEDDDVPKYGYPYDPTDGREDIHAGPACPRVLRGGAWYYVRNNARAAYRLARRPVSRNGGSGFRCVSGSPLPGTAVF